MYTIETDNLTLKLEIVPVGALRPHEATLPSVADRLQVEFQNWAHLQNPIIVDENHVVLDGNHRAVVFRRLGFRFMPVCKIDYFNATARLRYWFRRLDNLPGVGLLSNTLTAMGACLDPVGGRRRLRAALENEVLCCGLQRGNHYSLVRFPPDMVNDAVSAYRTLHRFQQALETRGISVEYIPCRPVRRGKCDFETGSGQAVIWTPPISKEMVVAAARRKQVFAPKTTRHLIPARPLNVNVSSHWCKQPAGLEEINARFEAHLRTKRVRKFGPGQVIDGRYYEEELYIFFDPEGPAAGTAGRKKGTCHG